VSVEQEPCGLAFPDDFDCDAVKRFAAAVREKKELDADQTDQSVLEGRRLGKFRQGEFVPNIACALLFAKDPRRVVPGCMIRFLKYQGDTELTGADRNVVRDVFIEGRVPEMIVEADRVIEAQVRTFSALGRDGKFYTQPEYPREAWYEAVVNACAHRSYSLKGMNIFIKMFDNRLIVESPGGFMPFVTPENIYDSHERRNSFLMEAMYYLRFVKCEHEGAKRIRNEMAKMALPPPEFEQKEVHGAVVRVTLRNDIKNRVGWIDKDATDIVGPEVFDNLNDQSRRIVNFIAEHKKINVTQAAKLTGKRWHAAKKLLDQMGVLRRVRKYSRDSTAHYVLRPKKASGQ
jgi:ATP-dependent DNA helicase RecG